MAIFAATKCDNYLYSALDAILSKSRYFFVKKIQKV